MRAAIAKRTICVIVGFASVHAPCYGWTKTTSLRQDATLRYRISTGENEHDGGHSARSIQEQVHVSLVFFSSDAVISCYNGQSRGKGFLTGRTRYFTA